MALYSRCCRRSQQVIRYSSILVPSPECRVEKEADYLECYQVIEGRERAHQSN